MRIKKDVVLTDGDDDHSDDNTTQRKYYYTGSAVLFVADSSNNKLLENILMPNGTTLMSARYEQEEEGNPINGYYTFNTDIRGSITNILNNGGTLTTGYVYDEYGNQIKTGDEDFLNEATYTGAIYDDESELYYMNARYYSSATGQFTTRDTYLGNAYNPATHNLYTYTGNNPINFVDPTGHAWYHWAIAAAIVVVAAVVVVATCGAALPAIAAITAVASGTAAATTAATVAAGVFIASSTALGVMAIDAAVNSNSIKEFMDKGDWGTVGATLSSAVMGGFSSYVDSKNMSSNAAAEVNASNTTKGWKVGQPVNNLTKAGNRPTWPTVQRRVWKNERNANINTGVYNEADLKRMARGNAPLVEFKPNGKMYPMELHHPNGRVGDDYWNFEPVTPWKHTEIDPHRYWKP